MHDHEDKTPKGLINRVILMGNANVGKSVIFGLLTGKYVTVSNYPGTTVEVTHGNVRIDGATYHLMDTPGTNSLIPLSEDERVTRDILIDEPFNTIIQVADAKNMKRTLMLAVQAAECGKPMMLVLNMQDEARERGIDTDNKELAGILGIEIIQAIAPQKKGIGQIRSALAAPRRPTLEVAYPEWIEKAVGDIAGRLPDSPVSRRALALMILAGAPGMRDWLKARIPDDKIDEIEDVCDNAQKHFDRPLAEAINAARLAVVERIMAKVVSRSAPGGGRALQAIGRYSTHPFWGLPILAVVLYVVWLFVGDLGAGVLVGFLETSVFGQYLNPLAERLASGIPFPFIRDLLVGPYGVVTMALTYAVAIILPITVTFFIAFGILEDSGYLPRLAVMSNRIFAMMGLNGKAVLPMVLGLGCVTMATMTTRILETRRERIITTFLLALAVPCSAQLGVTMGLLSAVSYRVTVIWLMSVVGTLLLGGWLASKVVAGERPALFIELPPVRIPRMMNVFKKTMGRVEWYLREAVPLFVIGTLMLFSLDRFGMLGWIRAAFAPVVVGFLGLPEAAADALIMGFLRRDYGAAGFFEMFKNGLLTPAQVAVSLVTVTLFVPCLASFLMMVKERGMKSAALMLAIVMPYAIISGGAVRFIIDAIGIVF